MVINLFISIQQSEIHNKMWKVCFDVFSTYKNKNHLKIVNGKKYSQQTNVKYYHYSVQMFISFENRN